MMHELLLNIGPACFRIGSAWRAPMEQLRVLYSGFPKPESRVADFTVRLEPAGLLRRWWRPSVQIAGDYMLPDAAPMALRHGLLAAEMGMNLQMALGWRRHLLIHASSVERNGRALVMTGESGSGKSTLAAQLGERGWRFMGDEFALIDLQLGVIHPFPRLVSLKNTAIRMMQADVADPARFGPLMVETPKGDIAHLVPSENAIRYMTETAMPALLLFPRFGFTPDIRVVAKGETFMRLTQASTNYVALGEAGFQALHRFVDTVPAIAVDYQDGEGGMATIEQLWEDLA